MEDKKMEWTFDCWKISEGSLERKYIIASTYEEAINLFKQEYPNYGFDEPYIDY